MAAVLVEVAEAVTASLNDADFEGLEFEAQRTYADWDDELKDLDCLHVDVVPVGYDETDLDSRESVGYAVSVDILVRKRFGQLDREQSGKVDKEEIDRLVLLVEEIHEWFCEERLTDYDAAVWRDTAIRSAYSRKHLRECGMFFGVVRVRFDVSQRL